MFKCDIQTIKKTLQIPVKPQIPLFVYTQSVTSFGNKKSAVSFVYNGFSETYVCIISVKKSAEE